MKIGIFIDILKNRKTGIEYYTQNLIQHLLKIDKKNKYYFIQDKNTDIEFEPEIPRIFYKKSSLLELSRKIIRIMPMALILAAIRINPFKYIPKFFLFKNEELNSLDIIFSPNFGVGINHNLRPRTIVTVHDLTPILMPEHHRKDLVLFFNTIFKESIMKTDCVIATSKSTKNDVIACLGIPPEKIKVAYSGIHQYIKHTNTYSDALKKYGLPDRYILYFGTLEPRKNIDALIKAFAQLKKDGYDEKLVIAGGRGWNYENLFRLVEKLNLKNDVIFTGYVDELDVSKIYSAAKLFVCPSLYEGFGFPVIEAMACKCPVITSDTSSLPESGGDAAILVNPKKQDELCTAMKKVLDSKEMREEMIRKGLVNASKFNWDKTANEIIQIFEKVMKNS